MPDMIPLRRPGLRSYLASLWNDPTVPFWLRILCAPFAFATLVNHFFLFYETPEINPNLQTRDVLEDDFGRCTTESDLVYNIIKAILCIAAASAYWVLAFAPPTWRWRRAAILATSAIGWIAVPVTLAVDSLIYFDFDGWMTNMICTTYPAIISITTIVNPFFLWGTLWYFHICFTIEGAP